MPSGSRKDVRMKRISKVKNQKWDVLNGENYFKLECKDETVSMNVKIRVDLFASTEWR
jgi:hypothetical protein